MHGAQVAAGLVLGASAFGAAGVVVLSTSVFRTAGMVVLGASAFGVTGVVVLSTSVFRTAGMVVPGAADVVPLGKAVVVLSNSGMVLDAAVIVVALWLQKRLWLIF